MKTTSEKAMVTAHVSMEKRGLRFGAAELLSDMINALVGDIDRVR